MHGWARHATHGLHDHPAGQELGEDGQRPAVGHYRRRREATVERRERRPHNVLRCRPGGAVVGGLTACGVEKLRLHRTGAHCEHAEFGAASLLPQ